MAGCVAADSVEGIFTLYLKEHLTKIFSDAVDVASTRNQLRLQDERQVRAMLDYTHGSFSFSWCLRSHARELTCGQRLFVNVVPDEHFLVTVESIEDDGVEAGKVQLRMLGWAKNPMELITGDGTAKWRECFSKAKASQKDVMYVEGPVRDALRSLGVPVKRNLEQTTTTPVSVSIKTVARTFTPDDYQKFIEQVQNFNLLQMLASLEEYFRMCVRDAEKDSCRIMTGPPGTGKSFFIFIMVQILCFSLPEVVPSKRNHLLEVERLMDVLDGQEEIMKQLIDDLVKVQEGCKIIGIVTPSNDLRHTYCEALVAWIQDLEQRGYELPCKIVYVGPDEENILPDNRFVENVPYPKTNPGSDPKSSQKPLLVIGCLSRFCAWAHHWNVSILCMLYDEFGMSNWLDVLLAVSVVHRQGKLIGVGDDKQTSSVVDSNNLVIVKGTEETIQSTRGTESNEAWEAFLHVQRSIMMQHRNAQKKVYGKDLKDLDSDNGKAFRARCCVPPLTKNRRSHEKIVRLAVNLFYDGNHNCMKPCSTKVTKFQSTCLKELRHRCIFLDYDGGGGAADKSSLTTSRRNDLELAAMSKVRQALLSILGSEYSDGIMSLSAYTLQASRMDGRALTVTGSQGDSASIVIYGPTTLSFTAMSAQASLCNVALTRAVDLFIFVAPREKYARQSQPVKKPTGGTTVSFARLIPTWMTVDEFCKALSSVQAGEDTIERSINKVIDVNRWKLASPVERLESFKKRGFWEFDRDMPHEKNIKKPRVHFDD